MFTWLRRLVFGPAAQDYSQNLPPLDLSFPRIINPPDNRDYLFKVIESMEKKDLLRLELENGKWILEYEEELNDLRKQTATQREEIARTGGDTKRLKQLDAYLENLGRNLSLD